MPDSKTHSQSHVKFRERAARTAQAAKRLANSVFKTKFRVLSETQIDSLSSEDSRWKFALDGAGHGLWDWNAKTNEVHFSTQWKKMLGFKENEIGNSLEEWSNRMHPDDSAMVYSQINRHFSGEDEIYNSEHRVMHKDGEYRWILDRGKVISWDSEGNPLRVVGTHTDITERKKAESALRESEENTAFFSLSPRTQFSC